MLFKRTERVKLYPSQAQAAQLRYSLDVCRELYNIALEQRRDAWRHRRLSITHKDQYHQLSELRADNKRIESVYRELADSVLHKLDLAFRAFYRRVARGEKPGFPRFRSRARYQCLEYSHGDRASKLNASQKKLRLPNIGWIKMRRGRNIPAFGRLMVVQRQSGWYALFECKREVQPLPSTGKRLGIDMGIQHFYAASDGSFAPHLRLGQAKAAKIARLQRTIARRKRGGARRRQAVNMLARLQEKLRWARRDWHHKLSRTLINTVDVIALEKLHIRNMTRSARGTLEVHGKNVSAKAALNRKILDAGWRQFTNMLVEKAVEAGRSVVFVKAQYSSQTCPKCHHVSPENRRTQANFECTNCGHPDHADTNAAKVILQWAELRPAGSSAEESDCKDPRSVRTQARSLVTQVIE